MYIITEPLLDEGLKILRTIGEVRVIENTNPENLKAEIRNADAIVVKFARITKECIDVAHRLKVIAKHGVGTDNIDVERATERGIWVVNVPAANADSVAEFTIGLILAITRRIPEGVQQIKEGKWERELLLGLELTGKTLGIIGFGTIGQKVARKIKGFDMKLLTYDPFVSKERAAELGAVLVDLDTLLRESDIITLHLPLNKETRGLIGERELKMVKPSSFLINAARSEIVDKKALISAIKEKRLAGAALDVFETEPPPSNDELLALPNVYATPHIAAMTQQVQENIVRTVCSDVVRVLKGEAPVNAINRV